MKTVISNQYNNCVGCSACAHICPKSCIIMKTNHEGFLFPHINNTLCNDCGLCKERCPTHYDKFLLNRSKPDAYGAINLDQDIKANSSSGGLFSALATSILEESGVVFGAAFDENMRLVHIMVDSSNKLDNLRGSKYLQSNLEGTFHKVKDELKKQKYVLFVGTPCQVAGLYSFLDSLYDKLLTCDFICLGVPSPKIFQDYLKGIERKKKKKILNYKFRDKTKGWKNPSVTIEFENGFKQSILFKKESFTAAFSKKIILRRSCYSCKFSKIPRVADITLADFWGVNIYYPELDDNKGTSLILINNNKGKLWFDLCSNQKFSKEVDIEKALKYNKYATGSVDMPPQREAFFNEYKTKGYAYVEKKYMKPHSILWRAVEKIRILISHTLDKRFN